MCCHDSNWDFLILALHARLVLNVLRNFREGQTMNPHADEGIRNIAAIRAVIQSQSEPGLPFFNKHDYRYEQMKIIVEVAVQLQITAEDLEQWLTNQEKVREFFLRLESTALGYTRHGCC